MEAKPGRKELSRAHGACFTLDKEGTGQVTMQDACLQFLLRKKMTIRAKMPYKPLKTPGRYLTLWKIVRACSPAQIMG